MDTSGPFTPSSGLAQFADRGAWAQRGRRVTEPVSGENFVLLPLPTDADAQQKWTHLAQSLAAVESGPLRPPRAVINDDDALWLLFEDLPGHTLADAIGQLGGAVQEQVLPALAQALRAMGDLHERGLTLRRLSLRDLVSERSGDAARWSLVLTPDSGVRPLGPGAEAEEIRGDLIMVAAAATTVLTGRRPSAGRIRTPLQTVCPSLPVAALQALDALLDDLDAADPGSARIGDVKAHMRSGAPGNPARELADQLCVVDQMPDQMSMPDDASAVGQPVHPAPSPVPEQTGIEDDTESLPAVPPVRPRVLMDDDDPATEPTAADRVFSVLGQEAQGRGGERVSRPPVNPPLVRRTPERGRPARPWESQDQQSRASRTRKPIVVLVAAAVMIAGGAAAVWSVNAQVSPPDTQTASGHGDESQTQFHSQRQAEPQQEAEPQSQGPASAPATGGSAPTAPAATTADPETEVEQAVADLVHVRGQALRDDDSAALEGVYTPESPALEADRHTLDQLEADPATGHHAFSDLSMEVKPGSTQVTEATATSARVRTAVDAQGLPAGQTTSQEIEATVVKTQGGWRLETVKPR